MPIWITQDTVTANTPRNHSRTAWLAPLKERIQAAIRAYVQATPGGEEVTLAVFNAIPPADVAKLLPRGRNIDAGRRELGLRIPLELVEMYGARQIETYRRDNGRTASPRRTNRDWPRNFTPHRVVLASSTSGTAQDTAFREDFTDTALWADVFESWISALSDYRQAADDLGWWHSPAACASLLIGAIWRLPDAVCIAPAPSAAAHATPGDLWFSRDGEDCLLAIRAVYPADATSAEEDTRRTLDHAAWQLPDSPARRHVACFVIPTLSSAQHTMSTAAAIMDAAWKVAGTAGMARLLGHDDTLALSAKGGLLYPGVMLIVREV